MPIANALNRAGFAAALALTLSAQPAGADDVRGVDVDRERTVTRNDDGSGGSFSRTARARPGAATLCAATGRAPSEASTTAAACGGIASRLSPIRTAQLPVVDRRATPPGSLG